jgi:hypothetical protein
VPGNRLLVVADPKMLPALASGLRGGGAFEVLTVPLSDAAGALAASQGADAVAVFHGTAERPLAAALQALAPPLRDRGGRAIAVLQREQAGQRDECFRAGASDVLFMPMPKDQFVIRLTSAVRLQYPGGAGIPAAVSVATRSTVSTLDAATVTASGVHALRALPFKPGETVRLSWDRFQLWGLVVHGLPSTQIRFAGLTPEEETKLRDWLVGVAPPAAAPSSSPPVVSPVVSPSSFAAAVPPASAAREPPAAAVVAPAPSPAEAAAASATQDAGPSGDLPALHVDGVRAAPLAGPPPGFADRKPIRPQATRPPRSPTLPPTNGAALVADTGALHLVAAPAEPRALTPSGGTARAAQAPAPAILLGGPAATSGELASEAPGAPAPLAALEEPAREQAPQGPVWPVPASAASCQEAALCLLKDKPLQPSELTPEVAVAARKIVGLLGSTERSALDKAGPDSHLSDSLAARVALEVANADGVRLYSSSPAAVVDGAAVSALIARADAASARLQKEASQAISSGEVEQLQLLTAASAALSRDALNFKATADRLRGIGAAPRLGAGALDPSLVVAGPAPRPAPARTAGEPAPVRAELRDFTALDDTGRNARVRKLGIAALALLFVVAVVNALFFALPRVTEMSAKDAGAGVERIDVAGKSAIVTVLPAWVAAGGPDLLKLLEVLRSRGVQKAMLSTANGQPAGMLDVQEGKVYGLPKPGKAKPPGPAR